MILKVSERGLGLLQRSPVRIAHPAMAPPRVVPHPRA